MPTDPGTPSEPPPPPPTGPPEPSRPAATEPLETQLQWLDALQEYWRVRSDAAVSYEEDINVWVEAERVRLMGSGA